MLFMVVEHFKPGKTKDIYQRFSQQGRMMPEGLKYLDSWVSANLDRCFQLMECDDPRLFQEWILRWEDLAEFEIILLVSSKETGEMVTRLL
ncbi:DUF3303 family protein [Pleurocapsales cyanobacterium LEGE 10410]|nr:DUF3303 family protein [Pleurocapsales cyanobacterium LEGE 10410]